MHSCRHFLGLYPDKRPSCKRGRDVRAWAVRCNGGSNKGIGLRLPCTKPSGEAPLFDCPELDRKTDAEVEAQRAEMREQMDRLIKVMPKLEQMRRKMIANDLRSAKATCPWCGEKNTLKVSVAIGINNHMRAQCSACKEGFIE